MHMCPQHKILARVVARGSGKAGLASGTMIAGCGSGEGRDVTVVRVQDKGEKARGRQGENKLVRG